MPPFSGEPPPLLQATLSEAKYRTVLDRWRRCHAEGTVITNELTATEQTFALERRVAAMRQLLRHIRARALAASFQKWMTASIALSFLSAVRHERAAAKEAEAQLQLVHEEQRAAHEEMSRWRQREEDDRLVLLAALEQRLRHRRRRRQLLE